MIVAMTAVAVTVQRSSEHGHVELLAGSDVPGHRVEAHESAAVTPVLTGLFFADFLGLYVLAGLGG